MRNWLLVFTLVVCLPVGGAVRGDDRLVRLSAPDGLIESGLLKYILPRFSLKTQIKVEISTGPDANAVFGDDGSPIFSGAGQTWALSLRTPEHPGTAKFFDWITSDVGAKAITGYTREGEQMFALATEIEEETEVVTFEGDAELGLKLSVEKCGRCHVAAEGQKGFGIGSTPSFFVLRSLSDWDVRFQAFFALNPHPAFTQIADVTEPFPEDRPSPIVPVELSLDDLDAILAYVQAIAPADLGAPLQHQ